MAEASVLERVCKVFGFTKVKPKRFAVRDSSGKLIAEVSKDVVVEVLTSNTGKVELRPLAGEIQPVYAFKDDFAIGNDTMRMAVFVGYYMEIPKEL